MSKEEKLEDIEEQISYLIENWLKTFSVLTLSGNID